MSNAALDVEKKAAAVAKKRPTAFISAPASLETGPIRKVLDGLGVNCYSPDQIDMPGGKISQIVRQGMEQADLVIGVVDDTPASNAVFYELGIAKTLDKLTMVFLVGDVPVSTWLESGTPYFRYDPLKPSGIEYAAAQVLKLPRQGTKAGGTTTKRTRPLGAKADELLATLKHAGNGLRAIDFERIVAEAIRESGVTNLAEGSADGKYIDFAVWSDDIAPWVGNPLPIELRLIVRGTGDLHSAVGQLVQAMSGVSMPWGLLIYVHSAVNIGSELQVPNILYISAEEFLSALRDTSFGDLIRRMRNDRVHEKN